MDYKVCVNPDKEVVSTIRQALSENDHYCPCRLDKIPDNKCQCKEFRTQESTGFCHCGLFYKVPKINYVAVDFDGTIVSNKFPEIGEPNTALIEKLRLMHNSGIKIILHTCREDGEFDRFKNEGTRNYLTEAINWCSVNDVPIDSVNMNQWVPFGIRKIYADLYIDDRAYNINDVERL